MELPKSYTPSEVEGRLRLFWDELGIFNAALGSSGPPFCLILPPPNITGDLHMGHALVNILQDIVVRWKRMEGFNVLWIPGIDHAGIATQSVVERFLSDNGRKNVGEDELLGEIWEWVGRNRVRIVDQLKSMGCSCNWDMERFTMDGRSTLAVKSAFKKLFDDGLIYQGDYLVNWDPRTQTALSDDELEYEDRDGHLWFIKYPILGGSSGESITVATTRPETMFGDSAVAVSPSDNRYIEYVGKRVLLPLVGRELPIISDSYVKPEFGSGALKVTPAHDVNDWNIGERHGLQVINILNPDGTLNSNAGGFEGVYIDDARVGVVEALERGGYIERVEPYVNRVGVSYRSKVTIQPYLSKQWFIKVDPFKKVLLDVVKNGELKIVPESWEKNYGHWVENLRDWCISRQLVWGHRIPIWQNSSGEVLCCTEEVPDISTDPDWRQVDGVLDTWFSSALWPFSALGWPENSAELLKFYPNDLLITGHDILFFWVTRMIMFGHYFMGQIPFPKVLLLGLIYGRSYWREVDGKVSYISSHEKELYDLGKKVPRDVKCKWEKMSKSKGNVIDPKSAVDSWGVDAVRMALASSPIENQQIDLDRRSFEEFKNFANKLWNGSRFVLMNISITSQSFMKGLQLESLPLEDRWLLSQCSRVRDSVSAALSDHYKFSHGANEAYGFFWDQFCSNAVEMSKDVLVRGGEVGDEKQRVLIIALLASIRILHPFAPFITEEIFQKIKTIFPNLGGVACADPYTNDAMKALSVKSCALSTFPPKMGRDIALEDGFEVLKRVVTAIRRMKADMGIAKNVKSGVVLSGMSCILSDLVYLIPRLTRVDICEEVLHPYSEVETDGVKIQIFHLS